MRLLSFSSLVAEDLNSSLYFFELVLLDELDRFSFGFAEDAVCGDSCCLLLQPLGILVRLSMTESLCYNNYRIKFDFSVYIYF
jgi:hypothetical protein